MKKSLLFGALLAAAPLALLLPGCSGGTSGVGPLFPTPTPKPVATATPAPVSQTSNFTLGNGQRAILKTTIGAGNKLIGTIQILAPLNATRTAKTLTRTIRVGTFSITGVFTPERAFNITVRDGNTVLFTLTGLFPTATQPGSYDLKFGADTDTGTIPAATPNPTATPVTTATPRATPTATPVTTATPRATPTATPVATATPTATSVPATPGLSRVFDIAITRGAGFNGENPSVTIVRGLTPNFNNFTAFNAPSEKLGGDTNVIFEGPNLSRPARAGDTFALGNTSASTGIIYYSEATANPPARNFQSRSGTLRVTSVTDSTVNFTLENVVFGPQNFGATSATGTFTLNSKGQFSGN